MVVMVVVVAVMMVMVVVVAVMMVMVVLVPDDSLLLACVENCIQMVYGYGVYGAVLHVNALCVGVCCGVVVG